MDLRGVNQHQDTTHPRTWSWACSSSYTIHWVGGGGLGFYQGMDLRAGYYTIHWVGAGWGGGLGSSQGMCHGPPLAALATGTVSSGNE